MKKIKFPLDANDPRRASNQGDPDSYDSEKEAQSRVREEEDRITRGKRQDDLDAMTERSVIANGQHVIVNDLDAMTARMRKLAGKGPRRAKALREPHTSIAKVMQDRGRKNSRAKGNSYELRIAKAFAKWSGEHIRRTPMSGGWSNAKFGVSADLVCDNPKWPFHIECKKREGWHLDDLITGIRPDDTRSIEAWWKQTVESCPKKGYTTTPMLVFARNRGPSLLMMNYGDLETVAPNIADLVTLKVHNGVQHAWRVIITLDTFFANVRPPKHTKNHKKWSPT